VLCADDFLTSPASQGLCSTEFHGSMVGWLVGYLAVRKVVSFEEADKLCSCFQNVVISFCPCCIVNVLICLASLKFVTEVQYSSFLISVCVL
jgi:hypothetical protein